MKKTILLSILFLFISILAYSQEYSYSVRVLNNQGRAYSGVKIWFENKTTGEQIVKYTDNQGKTDFELTTEGLWSLNLIGMHDEKVFNLEEGVSGSGSKTITYDLETILATQEILRQRALTAFSTENINFIKKFGKQEKDKAHITVFLESKDGELYKDIPVSLVSVKDKKIYSSKTGKDSKARFVVPNNQRYAIDVEDAINYSFTSDLGSFTQSEISLGFKPTNIVEHVKNDTITQEMTPEIVATSTRTLITLRIAGGENGYYKNEEVFLSTVNSQKVYKGKTDENGEVSFLIPNGNKYMINFQYQFNVDVINLSKTHGQRTMRKQITYTPVPMLAYPEEFIPSPYELFLVDINALYLSETKESLSETDLVLEWGNENVNSTAEEAVLQLSIFVEDQKIDKEKVKPVNIALVIDKSGSMCGENMIEALKESMIKYVKALNPKDNIALVTFNSKAFLETEMKNASTNPMLIPLISDIEANGGTNIYAGMCMGYDELEKNYSPDKNNMLILLTDGYGSMPIDTVVNKSKQYRDKGISLTAVGVGEDYNAALLTLLTQENGTLLQHAGKSEDIYKVFGEQLSSSVYPIGTDAKIEIVYNNKISLKTIMGLEASENKNNIATIEIGNVFARKQQIALVKFTLQNIDKNIKNSPVIVRFSYKDIDNKIVKIEKEAHLVWQPESNKYELIVDNYQKKLYAIATMNRGIKLMADAFAAQKPLEARKILEDCKKDVDAISPDFSDKMVLDLYTKLNLYIQAINNFINKK